jgi:DNA-binding NarL/FixJ family response regulator
MRLTGIRQIPRGLRKSTLSNQALLTSRELDILDLLKSGMQNKEIASKLYISAKTVDHHISAILFKLDVNSRVKAVQEAVSRGIIK